MIFLTTTKDNLGQHFWNKKEMLSLLSMLSCFFDDNEGQPWTITFGNKIEMLSLLFVLSCFFDDNEGQLSVVCGKQKHEKGNGKAKKNRLFADFCFSCP